VHMMSGIETNVKEFYKNKKKKNDSQKVKYKFKKWIFCTNKYINLLIQKTKEVTRDPF